MKRYKLRLIFRRAMADANGVCSEYLYKTDDIYLPDSAGAFQFPDVNQQGWLPEVVGGEWIEEEQ